MVPADNCTMSRGVEAREVEMANIQLEMNGSEWSGPAEVGAGCGECGADGAGCGAGAGRASQDSGSYIQVLVHKHRRGGGGGGRVARASSPRAGGAQCGRGDGAPLPARPLPAAALWGPAGSGGAGDAAPPAHMQPNTSESGAWNNVKGVAQNVLTPPHDTGPASVRVYYFERGDWLACAAGAGEWRGTRVERWAQAAGAVGERALAEALAGPRLALAAPVAVLVGVERLALGVVGGALEGCVQAVSDGLLKPALALGFNAVLRPPLVCAAHVGHAVRDALRPLWLAAGDALEPVRRLLAAASLVRVTLHLPPAPAAPHPHCPRDHV